MGRAAGALAAAVVLASGAPAAVPDLFGGGRLVAYTPSGFDPASARAPRPASLRADADELHRRGFRAITVAAGPPALAPVCRRFKRRGFRTVLVRVSDPRDARALRAAVKQRRCADGYVVGDGGLAAGRYTRADLERGVGRLRAATARPVAVREAAVSYEDPSLLTLGDWLFPLVNPYRAGETNPQDACGYSARGSVELRARVPAGVPVVLAETALPTAGYQGANENYQRAFYLCIETRAVRFEYFEAFDQPWRRDDPAAAHWGLFRSDGTPKMLMSALMAPRLAAHARGAWLRGRAWNVAPERFRVVVYGGGEHFEPEATSTLTRRGKWKAHVSSGRPATALLVASDYVPARGLERLPAVDGAGVFAAAVPAGGAR